MTRSCSFISRHQGNAHSLIKMDMLQGLKEPSITLKFQKMCGIQAATNGEACPPLSGEGGPGGRDQEPGKDNYSSKRRTKYTLKDKVNNNSDVHANGILPPLVTEDSDSDNTNSAPGVCQKKTNTYVVTNHFLYYVFTFAACLGAEPFYLTFFPFYIWNVDVVAGRECIIVWCMCMYLGQATKDVLRWPRPPAPPVFRLEADFAQEYAMPSTHAMAGTVIPFMLAYSTMNRYEISSVLLVSVAVCWCLLVCLSRLYLGVHSLLDVICGFLYAAAICIVFIPFVTSIQHFLVTHPRSPYVLIGLALFLCTVGYPTQGNHTRTKGDAVQIVAGTAGMFLGSWINYHYGITRVIETEDLLQIPQPTLKFFASSILRFLIGIVIVGLVMTVLKPISIKCASYYLGLSKPDKKNPSVETAYKFVTYLSIGVVIVWSIPILHSIMGLGRLSYFTEVLVR